MGTIVEAVMRTQESAADGALVARAHRGEREAREELAGRAGDAAYVFALQLTRSPEAARDVAQESVLRFFGRLDRFDRTQPVEPWLFSIVRNQVRDRARREKLRAHVSLDTWLEAGGPEPASPDDPAASAERRETRQGVWRAISELNDAHREILVLRDYHGLAYREISGVLSIPEGTVMSRLHAARKRLREIYISQSEGPAATEWTSRSDR